MLREMEYMPLLYSEIERQMRMIMVGFEEVVYGVVYKHQIHDVDAEVCGSFYVSDFACLICNMKGGGWGMVVALALARGGVEGMG
jgi:hypothetical protein